MRRQHGGPAVPRGGCTDARAVVERASAALCIGCLIEARVTASEALLRLSVTPALLRHRRVNLDTLSPLRRA